MIFSDKAADEDRSTQFPSFVDSLEEGGQPSRWGVEDASGCMAAGLLKYHGRSHFPEGPSNPQLPFASMVGWRSTQEPYKVRTKV